MTASIAAAAAMPAYAGAAGAGISVSQENANKYLEGYNLINDSAPQVNTYKDSSLNLGGARIILMRGAQLSRQLCIIVESADGHRIVVDGGMPENASYLGSYIKAHGGKVDAWLLTHPHSDHAGALTALLNKRLNTDGYCEYADIDYGDIYYSYGPMEFYDEHETQRYRLDFIRESYQAIGTYDQSKVHYNLPGGTEFSVGDINVRIINSPYLLDASPGNNSSICYMITVGGRRLLITGDIAYEAAELLLRDHAPEEFKADIVQVAHHGQQAASFAFYSAVSPEIALWPSSYDIWKMRNDDFSPDQETYTPALTYYWMKTLGVRENYCMADGNWILD